MFTLYQGSRCGNQDAQRAQLGLELESCKTTSGLGSRDFSRLKLDPCAICRVGMTMGLVQDMQSYTCIHIHFRKSYPCPYTHTYLLGIENEHHIYTHWILWVCELYSSTYTNKNIRMQPIFNYIMHLYIKNCEICIFLESKIQKM